MVDASLRRLSPPSPSPRRRREHCLKWILSWIRKRCVVGICRGRSSRRFGSVLSSCEVQDQGLLMFFNRSVSKTYASSWPRCLLWLRHGTSSSRGDCRACYFILLSSCRLPVLFQSWPYIANTAPIAVMWQISPVTGEKTAEGEGRRQPALRYIHPGRCILLWIATMS